MMISETDSLFLSCGEAFISPLSELEEDITDTVESSNDAGGMPSNIGMYTVGIHLGSGAFGEVRLGTNRLTGDKVALKFLKKSDIMSMGAAERTSTEIQCLTSLDHGNIIRLYMVTHFFSLLLFYATLKSASNLIIWYVCLLILLTMKLIH